ncbi:hypothetical protein SCHPADRAFT_1000931 [Schizopora paradoxa]|uniref:F-box domain-containing protein n=1 Tax=Schizopora paradoxa TaxID=27342 RepID=A0A0H2RUK2_9AGAM|nr:hypothetical protein SCHPADRAFT_1000931 [Schizopora paradoxa]
MTSSIQEYSHAIDPGDAPGSTSNSFSSSETDAEFIDDNIWPLLHVTELLKDEVERMESERHHDARYNIKHEVDWRNSASFRDGLWSDFKISTNLSPEGISDLHNCGFKRYDEILGVRWQLKNMVTLLDLLKTTAQEILDPVETELKRSSCNIGLFLNRLPLDLLAETIRFACSDSDVYELINMSHINQRFRGVVLSMGDMWSRISSDMPIGILRLSIERSRNAPLDLEGYFIERFGDDTSMSQRRKSRAKSFITEISQCSSRWNNIEFSIPASYSQELESYGFYFMLLANFPCGLHVPRLKSLSISHYGNLPDSQNDEDTNHGRSIEALRFYQSWKAPNLRMLTFSRIVPAPIHGASIEVLLLDLHTRDHYSDVDYLFAFRELVSFLQETPSLQTLRLTCNTSGPTDSKDNLALPTVTLHYLRDLTLVLTHEWFPPDDDIEFSLSSFTDCMRVPDLSTLRVKIETTSPKNLADSDVTTLIRSFIPRQEFNSLQKLFIFVFDHTLSSSLNMGVALDKYPSLRSLTLGITGKLVITPGSSLHPNVRRRGLFEQIKLLGCSQGAEAFLTWLAGELGDSGQAGQVAKVKVVVKLCQSIEKSDVSNVFPSDQLEFEDIDSCSWWNFMDESRTLGYGYFCDETEE